ncbi:MAG: hypothetical protein R2877_04325 [Bdellovibrionota bacterium]
MLEAKFSNAFAVFTDCFAISAAFIILMTGANEVTIARLFSISSARFFVHLDAVDAFFLGNCEHQFEASEKIQEHCVPSLAS